MHVRAGPSLGAFLFLRGAVKSPSVLPAAEFLKTRPRGAYTVSMAWPLWRRKGDLVSISTWVSL